MRVGDGVCAFIFRPVIFAGPLGKSHEETLVGIEPVGALQVHGFRGVLPGGVGQDFTAQVGDVFAFGELRIDVNVVHDDILSVLIHDAFGALGKLFGILLGPPILQISFGVELAAFVVKPVSEFVSDGAAGVAIIRRGVLFRVVKRRLQTPAGKLMSFICGL